jgi:phosphatidylglycerol lysyltransferase
MLNDYPKYSLVNVPLSFHHVQKITLSLHTAAVWSNYYHHARKALGDPCGDPDDFDAVILAFRNYADEHDLTPCFHEISEVRMHHYHDAGFALFKLSETAMVELANFTTAGKLGEGLRQGVNRAKRGGVEFELLEHPPGDDTWSQLRTIYDLWLAELGSIEALFET